MLYLLDANVLIDADRDYYPIDRVPEFWDWLLSQATAGRLKVPLEVYEEVVAGKGTLPDWLKDHRTVVVLDESVVGNLVRTVIEEGYSNDLTDEEIEKVGRDPFLIAYALADSGSRCVVTTETSRPRRQRANRKVPDVCDDFSITHCNTFARRPLDFRTGSAVGTYQN